MDIDLYGVCLFLYMLKVLMYPTGSGLAPLSLTASAYRKVFQPFGYDVNIPKKGKRTQL
jgi:hypothetical protein